MSACKMRSLLVRFVLVVWLGGVTVLGVVLTPLVHVYLGKEVFSIFTTVSVPLVKYLALTGALLAAVLFRSHRMILGLALGAIVAAAVMLLLTGPLVKEAKLLADTVAFQKWHRIDMALFWIHLGLGWTIVVKAPQV